jgi:FMN phosphatase YigB (HAD superfamily)
MDSGPTRVATSFDLFGTLVAARPPADPASAVAAELRERGVPVPDDWSDAYADPHLDVPDGAEVPLATHVRAALESRGVDSGDGGAVRRAVVAAFDAGVETRAGASEAVTAAAERGPVGVLSNCSVRGLVGRALAESTLDPAAFDAVVTSVDCGWRKPDPRAFGAVAAGLGVDRSALVHVGDDDATDGGADRAGATAVLLDDAPLARIPPLLEADAWPP